MSCISSCSLSLVLMMSSVFLIPDLISVSKDRQDSRTFHIFRAASLCLCAASPRFHCLV
jgi:hypothetical protein